MREAIRVHDLVAAVPGYDTVCHRSYTGGSCFTLSVPQLWRYNTSLVPATALDIVQALSVNPLFAPNGRPVPLSSTLGGITRDDDEKIVKALATQLLFVMDGADSVADELFAFEGRMLSALNALRDGASFREAAATAGVAGDALTAFSATNGLVHFDLSMTSNRSFQDESDRMVSAVPAVISRSC